MRCIYVCMSVCGVCGVCVFPRGRSCIRICLVCMCVRAFACVVSVCILCATVVSVQQGLWLCMVHLMWECVCVSGRPRV